MTNMTTIRRIFWAHLFLSTALFAAGYAFTGHLLVALALVLSGALWFAVQQQGLAGLGGLFLFIYSAAGALAFRMSIPAWLILPAVIAALAAWDLGHFLQRLHSVERIEYATGFAQAHLRRLALVEAGGLVLGALALLVQARIPFWWETLFVLLAVIGISRLVAYIRGSEGRG